MWAISGNAASSETFSSSFNEIAGAAPAARRILMSAPILDDVRCGERFRGRA
jgi:hypothetical protein